MSDTPADLVIATLPQRAERWRLHHAVWGDGFAPELFSRREQALAEDDACREQLRMWLLVDAHGHPLASCETWHGEAWHALPSGHCERVRCETVASVLVEPRLRHQGHALRLLQRLRAELAFEGTACAALYTDVGPQLYRRAGWMLHAARESVLTVPAPSNWPRHATPVGIGQVADLLRHDQDKAPMWLLEPAAPTLCEMPSPDKVAWFAVRSRYRAWARGQEDDPTCGAVTPAGGFALWTTDAPTPSLHLLLWRPHGRDDAELLAAAATAHAAKLGLREVIWWDADRDTGTDPFRHPAMQPPGATARDRGSALPMLAWLRDDAPMPLVWAAVERHGWA
jgi:ribosomal protein S18 acetylase RimI-like enzyme